MIPSSNEGVTGSLAGTRVLIVEDEMMVAMVLEDLLTELGCIVVKAGRVMKAVRFVASTEIDAAILDVNVAGESVYPVAHELQERGIPFIFPVAMALAGWHLSIATARCFRNRSNWNNWRRHWLLPFIDRGTETLSRG